MCRSSCTLPVVWWGCHAAGAITRLCHAEQAAGRRLQSELFSWGRELLDQGLGWPTAAFCMYPMPNASICKLAPTVHFILRSPLTCVCLMLLACASHSLFWRGLLFRGEFIPFPTKFYEFLVRFWYCFCAAAQPPCHVSMLLDIAVFGLWLVCACFVGVPLVLVHEFLPRLP